MPTKATTKSGMILFITCPSYTDGVFQDMDFWEQLRDARKRDPHEDKHKTQALRQLRNQEIEAKLPHPQCCDLAKKHIFPYRQIDMRTETVLNDGIPAWKSSFATTWNGSDLSRAFLTLHFCPFCGTKLPGFHKKANPPKHIVQDGDFRCKGCGERYGMGYCFCSHPESAWEIVT